MAVFIPHLYLRGNLNDHCLQSGKGLPSSPSYLVRLGVFPTPTLSALPVVVKAGVPSSKWLFRRQILLRSPEARRIKGGSIRASKAVFFSSFKFLFFLFSITCITSSFEQWLVTVLNPVSSSSSEIHFQFILLHGHSSCQHEGLPGYVSCTVS